MYPEYRIPPTNEFGRNISSILKKKPSIEIERIVDFILVAIDRCLWFIHPFSRPFVFLPRPRTKYVRIISLQLESFRRTCAGCSSTGRNRDQTVRKRPIRSMARPRIWATDCKIPDPGVRRGPDRVPRESFGYHFRKNRFPVDTILG